MSTELGVSSKKKKRRINKLNNQTPSLLHHYSHLHICMSLGSLRTGLPPSLLTETFSSCPTLLPRLILGPPVHASQWLPQEGFQKADHCQLPPFPLTYICDKARPNTHQNTTWVSSTWDGVMDLGRDRPVFTCPWGVDGLSSSSKHNR